MSNLKNYSAELKNYPENYDNLSDKDKNGILDLMNSYDKIAEDYFSKYKVSSVIDDDVLDLYNHYETKISAFKNAYEVIGIYVERWGNDKDKPWILATKKDADDYNNSINETAVLPKVTDTSWPIPEGDRSTKSSNKYRYLSTKDYSYNKEV